MASEQNSKSKTRGVDSKRLKEITCHACNKQYKDPRTLPCLHSFCSSCIKSLLSSEDKTQLELECPQCKKHISEKSTVDDLPEAFFINRQIAMYSFIQKVQGKTDVKCDKCAGKSSKAVSYCKDCSQFICDLCVAIHKNWSEFSSHSVVKLSELKDSSESYTPEQSTSGSMKCHEHSKECSLYCETCEEEMCNECMIKIHRDHQYNLATDSAKRYKEKMKQKAEKIVDVPKELEESVRRLDGITSRFLKQSHSATDAINKVFDDFEAEVVKQRKVLHDQVTTLVTKKTTTLGGQKRDLVALKNKVSDCQGFVSEALAVDHNSEFFVLQQKMSDRIAELNFEFSSTDLTPIEEPEIHFSSDNALLQSLPTFGNICDGSVLHPSPTFSKSPLIVKEVITFYIALSSAFYKMRGNPVGEVTADIESLRDGSTCPATVAVSNSGFAKIQCTFAERGRYRLIVQVSGANISGSPFSLFIRPASTQFDTPVRSITKLGAPKGIAVNPKHQMIISEEKAHTVSVFGRKCKKVASFGSYGTDEGQLNNPIGVAVDMQGNIFIADSKNNRVQKINSEGKLLLSFTGENIPDCGFLKQPTGLKISKDGDLYVVDRGNCRVVILDLELKFKRLFGSPGSAFGQLQDPWDIAFDENGFVYVTDIKLHCIHVFGTAGIFRGRIGAMGTQKGKLNRPSGIAIDQFGRIFVCEFGNHRVSIFHVSSDFIDCFSAGLNMVNPCAIVINDDGFICVSCAEAVHVF